MAVHITEDQLERAKNTDLVSYLESQGHNIRKYGTCYKLDIPNHKRYSGDLSSLSIFPNRKGWKRWSTGDCGGDAISFLEKTMNMSFQEAVLTLINERAYEYTRVVRKTKDVSEKSGTLKLPELADKTANVYAYLTKTRFIDDKIVNILLKEKKILQDKNNNAVFVGYDDKNNAKFACVRGTNSAAAFRHDCDNSDKRYAFSVDGTIKNKLFVFEAPIDLLSHATLTNMIMKNHNAWKVHSRLSLAGTADTALEHYLKDHPEITEINLYLDNDDAGRSAAEKYSLKYSEMGYKVNNFCPKHKDMNEDLMHYVSENSVLEKKLMKQKK